MTSKVQPLSGLLLALLGPIVWAVHFFVVYGLEAVLCTRASSPVFAMQMIVAAATAAAVASLGAFLIQRFRKPPNDNEAGAFLRTVSIFLALISIGALVGVAASAVHLSACVQPTG